MKQRILNLVAMSLFLVTFIGCEKEMSTEFENPMAELQDAIKVTPPLALPAPTDGFISNEMPLTNNDLLIIEENRLLNEEKLLQTNSPKGLPNGTFTFNESINISKNFSGTTIFDNSNAKAEIVSGGITFTPTFHFDAYISGGVLRNAQAYIANTVTGNATYKVTVKAAYENTYVKNLAYWTQTQFSLIGGVVPFWVTFQIQIDGGVYVKAAASCWMQQGITASSYVKIGAKWVNGTGWSNVSNYPSPTWSATNPSYSYNGNLTIQPYLNNFLTAKLYSVVGPQLLVTPYLTLYLNATPGNRYIDRTARLRGNVYFALQGLEQYTTYNKEVFNKSYSFSRIYF